MQNKKFTINKDYRGVILASTALVALIIINTFVNKWETSFQNALEDTLIKQSDYRQLLSYLQDAETGQRGFLITKNNQYLAPYNAALTKVDALIDKLVNEAAERGPSYEPHLKKIQTLIPKKIGELKQTIQLVREGNEILAIEIVNSDYGKNVMDEIRVELQLIHERADLRLNQERNMLAFIERANRISELSVITIFLTMMFYANKSYKIAKRLRENEARLSTILNHTVDGIITITDSGKIASFNQACTKIFGYEEKDILGKNIQTLVPDKHQTNHDSRDDQDVEQKKIIESSREITGLRASGEVFPVSLAISKTTVNNMPIYIGMVRDISIQKANEAAIQRYTKQLETSNKELDDFAHVASHDLKAPLRGILQLTTWIKDELTNPSLQVTQYLTLIQSRITRLELLLDDLLDYSRVNRKHGKFEEINIQVLVNDIFQLLNPRQGIELKLHIELGSIRTLAVPLNIILRNLISNAIKHHDKEKGVITVTAKPIGSDYLFSVQDDGPGIAKQYHERIFELFQTLKPRDEKEGSGMGLAIIKKILDMYHSNICVESDGKQGTLIQFKWPNENTLKQYVD